MGLLISVKIALSLVIDHKHVFSCVTQKLFWNLSPRLLQKLYWKVLRSAVGMTHSLRSDLWWTIPFHILLGHFGIPIGSLTIKSALARHTGVRRVFGSRQSDIQPHRCTWVVLWLFCFRSTPQRSLLLGPLSRVHFGESLVNRLYSEIDHTYLSIEAQCISHHYPQWTATALVKHYIAPASSPENH